MEYKNMHSLNNIKLVNDEFLNGFGRNHLWPVWGMSTFA